VITAAIYSRAQLHQTTFQTADGCPAIYIGEFGPYNGNNTTMAANGTATDFICQTLGYSWTQYNWSEQGQAGVTPSLDMTTNFPNPMLANPIGTQCAQQMLQPLQLPHAPYAPPFIPAGNYG
jgi:hypothetical protein